MVSGGGAGHQKNPVIRGGDVQPHPPPPSWPLRKGVGDLEIGLYKLLNNEFRELLRCWEGGAWQGMEAQHLPPHAFPVCVTSVELFICIPHNKPVNVSKVFFLVLWVILVNYWTWRKGYGKPWICSQPSRSVGNPDTPFATGVWSGGSLVELSPLTCRIWH